MSAVCFQARRSEFGLSLFTHISLYAFTTLCKRCGVCERRAATAVMPRTLNQFPCPPRAHFAPQYNVLHTHHLHTFNHCLVFVAFQGFHFMRSYSNVCPGKLCTLMYAFVCMPMGRTHAKFVSLSLFSVPSILCSPLPLVQLI